MRVVTKAIIVVCLRVVDGAAFGRSIQALCQHAYQNGGSAAIFQLRLVRVYR